MKKLKDFFSKRVPKPEDDPEKLNEALLKAIDFGNIEDVQAALKGGASADSRDHIAQTALMLAAKQEQPEVVALLLENKADVTLENGFRQTALHYALRENPSDAAALRLIAADAPLNGQDKQGATPAFYASQTGKAAVLATLAEKGADLKTPNKHGTTPLMMGMHHPAAAEELLKHDFGIDAQDNEGRTALMQAVLQERTGLVQKLLGLGANVNLKDNEGETAFSLARKHGIGGEILAALEKAGNAPAEYFHSGSAQAITPMKKIVFAPRPVSA